VGFSIWYNGLMATKIYEEGIVELVDGTKITVGPAKIKYLKKILDQFSLISKVDGEDETLEIVLECVKISMEQFYPQLSNSITDIEDNFDIKQLYKVLEFSAGIKLNEDKEDSIEQQAKSESDKGSNWDDLDLAKLESEVFLIGAWKNYEELETSISMPELISVLEMKREIDRNDKKFSAAMQGVDIDKDKNDNAWEDMKKRVLYKGKDANDITNLRGARAQKAGFGIGNGLGYEEVVG
jgi:hypothetical protein